MFTDIKPILDTAGESRKVILTPISKYLHQPCCQDQEPVKDFSFRVGPKGTSARWGPDKLSRRWGGGDLGAGRGGGVHLKAAGYDKVSELVASATEELMEMSVVSLRANPGRRGRDWEEAGGGRRGG